METQEDSISYVSARTTTFSDHLAALGAAFAALAVYWITLAPTVTGEDAGELIAAAYGLGIPHPPGYPLWCLLGKLFIELIPYGEVAWRVSLLSAVLAAMTVYITVLLALVLVPNRMAAVSAGLVLAFSLEFWEQSVIAEVYTLNAFFTVLCLYLLLRWSWSYNRRLLYAFAFIYGLSQTNHPTMALLAPVFILYVLWVDGEPLRRWRQYLAMLCLALLGLLPFLYLPISSRLNPAMDWGNPETLIGFWDVVSRQQYQHLITASPRTFSLFLDQCWVFVKTYAWQFTPWVCWLPLAGLLPIFRAHRSGFFLLMGSFLSVSLGAILIPNFAIEHHWIWLNTTYWIPAYIILAVFLAGAIASLLEVVELPPIVKHGLPYLIVLSPLLAHFAHNDRRNDFLIREYAERVLNTMEQDAIYIGSGDHTVFPLIYLQDVEGLRPDVTIANRYGYAIPELGYAVPEIQELASDVTLSRPLARPTKAKSDRILSEIMGFADFPIYSATRRASGPRSVVHEGLLYRYLRDDEEASGRDFFEGYDWEALDSIYTKGDWATELVLYEYFFARARGYFEEGKPGLAATAMARAANYVHGDKDALNNLGTLVAGYGDMELAVEYFVRSLKTDTGFVPAHLNLARAYLKLNRANRALAHAEHALEQEPNNELAASLTEKALQNVNALQR